jgi:hypothetical protein
MNNIGFWGIFREIRQVKNNDEKAGFKRLDATNYFNTGLNLQVFLLTL